MGGGRKMQQFGGEAGVSLGVRKRDRGGEKVRHFWRFLRQKCGLSGRFCFRRGLLQPFFADCIEGTEFDMRIRVGVECCGDRNCCLYRLLWRSR